MKHYKLNTHTFYIEETVDVTPSEASSLDGFWVTDIEPYLGNIGFDEKKWRNMELTRTDFIVPTTDHPLHSEYMAYRVALRNWPSTSDFPLIRPTL
jgi:hypothetical protein|tara:strand:+ start:481 stop:768 length:288 start_codon:yes stop_codon:yes gene_type:complete